LRHLVR
jgi:hypothetical protein